LIDLKFLFEQGAYGKQSTWMSFHWGYNVVIKLPNSTPQRVYRYLIFTFQSYFWFKGASFGRQVRFSGEFFIKEKKRNCFDEKCAKLLFSVSGRRVVYLHTHQA
jgi:hypothetical protein